MATLRPIGHIAANLQVLAVTVTHRMRFIGQGQAHALWVDDDGCVYLAPLNHPRAIAMRRHAPEHQVNTYLKARGAPFPLTAADIETDLRDARSSHAARSVHHAEADAA
ncbi:MAG TPA: hypothetical protein VFH59_17460 [Frateuria sp.]|uniref:hypothetical protein n=1 Tax=Frateuria sp. TaxID=2211372 RepID=UPI002D7F8357|nr:hypothetical protein [Frateuria sp.]HET6807227.1 hypothetical protein [Frateuria sp.]